MDEMTDVAYALSTLTGTGRGFFYDLGSLMGPLLPLIIGLALFLAYRTRRPGLAKKSLIIGGTITALFIGIQVLVGFTMAASAPVAGQDVSGYLEPQGQLAGEPLAAGLGAPAYAEEAPSGGIPSWVKDIAGFWSQDLIDDDSFIGAIQYLVEQKFITLSAMQAQVQEAAEMIVALQERVDRLTADNKKLEEMNKVLEHEVSFLQETYQCMVDCGVDFSVTSCEATFNDAHVQGIVKNTGERTLRLQYTIYLSDALGKGVAIDSWIIDSLAPGQTRNISEFIDYAGEWEYCGMDMSWEPTTPVITYTPPSP